MCQILKRVRVLRLVVLSVGHGWQSPSRTNANTTVTPVSTDGGTTARLSRPEDRLQHPVQTQIETMTKAQTALYFRKWSKVRKILIEWAGYSPKEADAKRHEIHEDALGKPMSSKDFKNKDLDAVLGHFDKWIAFTDKDLRDAPSRAEVQPCKRLIYAIKATGLPEAYLAQIARDQFGSSDWEALSEAELTKFRFTACARANSRRKATKQPV